MDGPYIQSRTEARIPAPLQPSTLKCKQPPGHHWNDSSCSFDPSLAPTTNTPLHPQEGITAVISLQLGNHAMAESMVWGFRLGETPVSHSSPPAPRPRPRTEGIITSCLPLVGTIQITLDE